MIKRAVCIGINDYPDEDNDLNGCVNDARAWASLLTEHFDFDAENVRLIEDSEATKVNMVGALQQLLASARLVMSWSSQIHRTGRMSLIRQGTNRFTMKSSARGTSWTACFSMTSFANFSAPFQKACT